MEVCSPNRNLRREVCDRKSSFNKSSGEEVMNKLRSKIPNEELQYRRKKCFIATCYSTMAKNASTTVDDTSKRVVIPMTIGQENDFFQKLWETLPQKSGDDERATSVTPARTHHSSDSESASANSAGSEVDAGKHPANELLAAHKEALDYSRNKIPLDNQTEKHVDKPKDKSSISSNQKNIVKETYDAKDPTSLLGANNKPHLMVESDKNTEYIFDTNDSQFFCLLCNIYTNSQQQVKDHLNGKAHKKAEANQKVLRMRCDKIRCTLIDLDKSNLKNGELSQEKGVINKNNEKNEQFDEQEIVTNSVGNDAFRIRDALTSTSPVVVDYERHHPLKESKCRNAQRVDVSSSQENIHLHASTENVYKRVNTVNDQSKVGRERVKVTRNDNYQNVPESTAHGERHVINSSGVGKNKSPESSCNQNGADAMGSKMVLSKQTFKNNNEKNSAIEDINALKYNKRASRAQSQKRGKSLKVRGRNDNIANEMSNKNFLSKTDSKVSTENANVPPTQISLTTEASADQNVVGNHVKKIFEQLKVNPVISFEPIAVHVPSKAIYYVNAGESNLKCRVKSARKVSLDFSNDYVTKQRNVCTKRKSFKPPVCGNISLVKKFLSKITPGTNVVININICKPWMRREQHL